MERVIKVTGTGNIRIKPDQTIIDLNFSNVRPTYEETLEAAANDVNIIKNALVEVGINKDVLKTTNFDVDTHYHSVKQEDGTYKSVFDGYVYHQSLVFTFDVDNKLLGKVLNKIGSLSVNPEFMIRYGVKDKEDAKNKLLASAVEDAKKKAEIISKAAGVKLGEILSINYSWLNVEFNTRPYGLYSDKLMCCRAKDKNDFSIDIEPDDIERSDNVSLVFEIK